MRRSVSYLVALLLANFLTIVAYAQQKTVISGNVENSSTKEKVGSVSVTVKGAGSGTFTDDKGNFKVITDAKLPLTLTFSSVGYEMKEVTVSSASQKVTVELKPSNSMGQEVVVSASRVPQKILESPVSIERVSSLNIRNAPAANFYDVITTLKGVDVTTSSLTFKTPTTRGFNSSGNTRFNQLVDGMDNMAPGLNFSVGAIIGLSELDVDNMELLSGASSALYGPGGMNGTLLMTSKNPFKYQGLSFLVKEGIMNTDRQQRDASAYHNWNLRWAKKINEKLAFKMNMELLQAKDWLGTDNRNYLRNSYTSSKVIAGDRKTDPNYDGINVYGDETTVDMRGFFAGISANLPGAANFIASNGLLSKAQNVSRTGYAEKDVVNPNTVSYKISGSLHYKITPAIEASLAAYWGTGNTVYTGSERYSIKDFKMGQYKFELNHKNWMFRAYTTQENAGETFNTTVTTRLFNESWKKTVTTLPDGTPNPQASDWLVQYTYQYLSNRMSGMTEYDAHQAARAFADQGRPVAGTAAFKTAFDAIRKKPISAGGGLLLDKSDLYNVEGNYNLSHITSKFADILVGGNFKRYVLNSQGTLFADTAGRIGINEFGAYVQLARQVIDRLKLTVSGRYDKNENFKGRFTPRATAVVKVTENSNFRLSYQTAYRFPSNQQQWISLVIGSNQRLIGGNPAFRKIFNFDNNPVYDYEKLRAGTITAYTMKDLKPEALSSFEAGYKGVLLNDKLLFDVYGYYGQYQDFIGRITIVQSKTNSAITVADTTNGNKYSIPINSTDKVKTYGFGLSVDYRLPLNFTVGANVASDNLKDVPSNFVAYFNAPKYKVNAYVANSGFGWNKRFGFNLSYRWQDGFYYQGDFANGNLPQVHTLDAQVSFKLPKTKSILKVGANNLLNQYYYNAIGNSRIGGLYYVSFGYNVY